DRARRGSQGGGPRAQLSRLFRRRLAGGYQGHQRPPSIAPAALKGPARRDKIQASGGRPFPPPRSPTMRIAVTGGTGFLGRYLVHRPAAPGHHLRCWRRPTSDMSGFGAAAGSIEWLTGRLGDASAAELVHGADAVVHAAVEWAGPRNRGRGSHGGPDVFLG